MGYLQVVCCLLAVTPALISAEEPPRPLDIDLVSSDDELSKFERKFFLHTRDHPEGVEYDFVVLPPYLIEDADVKVITHGFKEKRQELQPIVDGYLLEQANVITFSWDNPGDPDEIQACLTAVFFGRFIVGIFLEILIRSFNFKPEQIHLIGSGMGAHLMGSAGRMQTQKFARITGLNPHERFFDGNYIIKMPALSARDAKFVDVYRTIGKPSGMSAPIGTVDFYPNGGKIQPGCQDDKSGKCNFQMAKKYYAESIEFKDNFWGVKCPSYEAFEKRKCNHNPLIIAGAYGNTTASGTFFFRTNAKSPYGKKKDGARY